MDRLRHRPASPLAPTIAVLLAFAGCFGTRQRGEGCSCGPGAEPPPAAGPAAQPVPDPLAEAGATHGTEAPEPAAPEPPAPPEPTDEGWTRRTSRAGTYEVCWRPRTGAIARNEDFTLEVWVLHDGKPVRDAKLAVNAWMPDHGHGMLRAPRTVAHGDGSFEIEGMLLHMRGHWQLFFEVLEGTLSETTECDLDL